MGAIVAVGILGSLLSHPASGAVPAQSCKKAGQKSKIGSVTYICVKSGKKYVWKKVSVVRPVVQPSSSVTDDLPPVTGPEPSQKVIAFYYAWYGTPTTDGKWIHWDQASSKPPEDIGSDYFPKLGPYSSNDPKVVAQHMAWLRNSGVGVIAVSYWGAETDRVLPVIMTMAEKYRIKVAFHIEPECGRTASEYAPIVERLAKRYGASPAFFRTTKSSPWLTNSEPKPIFFVWATAFWNNCDTRVIDVTAWASANDQIHKNANSLVIACPCGGGYSEAVTNGHFDGGYNYSTLHLKSEGGFEWSKALPKNALYIPSVIPGNSADRVGYEKSTLVPRRDGLEYVDQWTAALSTGVAPDFVSITSFNEWHEGSGIEPARSNFKTASRTYLDFGDVGENGYLEATASWVRKIEQDGFSKTATTPVKITVSTSSDWSLTKIVAGELTRPWLISRSDSAASAHYSSIGFDLSQSLQKAQASQSISVSYEFEAIGRSLSFVNDSGWIGQTTLTIEIPNSNGWKVLKVLTWSGGPENNKPQTVLLP